MVFWSFCIKSETVTLVIVKFSPVPTFLLPILLAVPEGSRKYPGTGLRGIEQPEHDEECHHGGDEICIGNLPGAAVVSTMTRFLLDNDDGAGAVLHTYSYAGAASAAGAVDSLPPPRHAFSNSWKVGRTCPGMARRATSTAMMGAVPFRKEKIKTRRTCRKACSSSAAFAMFEASGPTKP